MAYTPTKSEVLRTQQKLEGLQRGLAKLEYEVARYAVAANSAEECGAFGARLDVEREWGFFLRHTATWSVAAATDAAALNTTSLLA